METLLSADLDLGALESEFSEFKFSAYTSEDKTIVCFACFTSSQQNIVSHWGYIQNIIAGVFQAADAHAKWNYYLAFFCPDKISVRDIYKIQNDRFCCRKLVFDQHSAPYDPQQLQQFLSSDILGATLRVEGREAPMEYNCEISSALNDVPFSHSSNDKAKRRATLRKMIEGIFQ